MKTKFISKFLAVLMSVLTLVSTTTVISASIAPATPSISEIYAIPGGAKLKWKKVKGATGYQIKYSKNSDFSHYIIKNTNGVTVSKSITSLTKGKRYYFRIRAYKTVKSKNYYSKWSKYRSVVTLNSIRTTSLISLNSNSPGTITAKWNKVSGSYISGYQLVYSTGSSFSNSKSLYVGSAYSSRVIRDLTEGKKYYVKIRCYKTIDGKKYYGSYSKYKYVTVKRTPVTPTSISSLTSDSPGSLTVKWNKITGVTGYNILYSPNSDFTESKSLYVGSSYSSKTVSNLTEGKRYYVKIRCYKTIDGTKYYSAYSTNKYVTVKKTALPSPEPIEPEPVPDYKDCIGVCFSDDMEVIDNGGSLNGAYYFIDRPIPKGEIKGIVFSSKFSSAQMQYFYICEQSDNGLRILKTIELSGVNAGLNYIDVQLETENETYIVTKSWMSYTGAGSTGQMLYSVTLDGDKFTNKSGVANFQVKMTVFVKESEKEDVPDNQIVVAKDGSGSYTTINAALKQAYTIESRDNPITIIIKPGVYKEVLFIGGKHNVSLVGTDRDTCIIRDDSGNYNNAPVRIEGNSYIANLTIIATHSDDPTYETRERDPGVWMDTVGSYAIHIDDAHNDDDLDYLYKVENCKLYSEQMAVVGCGLHKNQSVELVNCEIIKNLSQALYDNPVYTKHGAVFCHTLSSNTKDYTKFGYQRFSMTGCSVTANIDRTLELGTVGTEADVTFVNNTFYSDALELEKSVTMHGDFKLTQESSGNNVTKLNC